MNLDTFLKRLKRAIKHLEESQKLIDLSLDQINKVKIGNEWLDNVRAVLLICEFAADTTIKDLKTIIDGTIEDIEERK